MEDVPFPLSALGIELPEESAEPGTGRRQPSWVHERLALAAEVVREERFVARIGSGCRYCPFRGSCPAQPTGRQVVA